MRNLITFCLFAATIAKVAAVLALGPASIELDAQGYWELSELVMQGDVLMMGEPIAYRTPVYPWFLAAVRAIFGTESLMFIVVLQGAMAVATIWIAGRIATEVAQSDWAMPLTFIVALPALSALTYSATVLSESLFTFLLMLNLLSVLMYLRTPTAARASWVGVSFALTLLTRPIVMYLWVAHLTLVLWKAPNSEPRLLGAIRPAGNWLVHLGIATLWVAIVVSPWLIRNERLFDSPFLTEFLGRNIWIVTFQDGSGAGLDLPDTVDAVNLKRWIGDAGETDQWRATWSVSRALVDSGLSDPEADRLMKRVSIDAIKSNPGPAAYKSVRRTANFWRCAVTDLPVQGSETGLYFGQRHWSFPLTSVSWAIENRLSQSVWINTLITTIIVVAVMMLIIHSDTRRYGIWIALILSYFAAVTGLVEIPNYRYRIVVEPLSAAAVGSALAIIVTRLWSTEHPHDSSQFTNANG